jgi:selenide,water dikinase
VSWMSKLNNEASRLAVQLGLRSATDVTGFGLIGHTLEVAEASSVGMQLSLESIPIFDFAHRYASLGYFAGGAFDNRHYFGTRVRFVKQISEPEEMLLFDPQTSGGLLLVVPPKSLSALQESAQKSNLSHWVIGEVVRGAGINIV